MGKLKDAHIISNEKGSIAKFLVYMSVFVTIDIPNDFIFDKIYLREDFKWGEYVLEHLIFAAALTIIYFISRWLAYRTNIFPNAKYREAIHGVSFFLLLIISIILAVVIIGGKG
jgi:hypothetical protein